jgi:hypothetical protein
MIAEFSRRLLRRDVSQKESFADDHEAEVGNRHDKVDRERHGNEEGERNGGCRRVPEQHIRDRGNGGPHPFNHVLDEEHSQADGH